MITYAVDNSQVMLNGIDCCHFHLYIYMTCTKQLNPCPAFLASHVIYSWPSTCPREMGSLILKITQALIHCRNKPHKSSMGNFQHQHLPELLVIVYRYYVMMKVYLALYALKLAFLKSSNTCV